MNTRTIIEMETALNNLLRGHFKITTSKILNENTYEFCIDHGMYNNIHSDKTFLYFTPSDSDSTLSKGLWNKGLLAT